MPTLRARWQGKHVCSTVGGCHRRSLRCCCSLRSRKLGSFTLDQKGTGDTDSSIQARRLSQAFCLCRLPV